MSDRCTTSPLLAMMLVCVHLIAILCSGSLHFHIAAYHAHDEDTPHGHTVFAHVHEDERGFRDVPFVMAYDHASHHHNVSTIRFVGINTSKYRSTIGSDDGTQPKGLSSVSDQTIPPSSSRMVLASYFGLPPLDRSFHYSSRAPPAC